MSNSGLVVNNLSTGGEIFKLKKDVVVDKAQQKAQKDGKDQVYFEAGGDKYVLEGDNLKLGEINNLAKKSDIPKILIKLDHKPVEISITGIDDEVSTVKEGFVKNGKILSHSTTAIGVGLGVSVVSGLSLLVTGLAGSKGSVIAKVGLYTGLISAAAGVGGAAYYAGKSIYQGNSNKPQEGKLNEVKDTKINSANTAKPAGIISKEEKQKAVRDVAVDILLNEVLK